MHVIEFGQQGYALVLSQQMVGQMIGIDAFPKSPPLSGLAAQQRQALFHDRKKLRDVSPQSVIGGGQLGGQIAERTAHSPTELRFEFGLDCSDHVGNRAKTVNWVVIGEFGQTRRKGDRVPVDNGFGEFTL